VTRDPLSFPGYSDAAAAARSNDGSDESIVAGSARIGGIDVEIAAFDFTFFGGSMGEITGERLAAAMERAISRGVPFLLRTATGGARMQEGMRSLVQMPKVVSARIALGDAGQPFIAVFGHPTTGGVLASVAALADVTVAEAGATIGFAGPRVAERFTGTPLPDGSHSANSAYAAGLVDELVSSGDAHSYVAGVLKVLGDDGPAPVDPPPPEDPADIDPWDLVQLVRSPDHPKGSDLVRAASDSFVELRGDRAGAEDPAVFASLARIAGRKVLAIALDRDHHPGPHGFRKARRCLDIAARLRIPVITLVDTRGADPSAPSEAGGIAWEIARLFEAMLRAPVPILSFVTGEGGSGGALAFATGDRLIAFDRSIFSVIGPEGAAEILWRDGNRTSEAAAALRLTATDLLDLGIADEVVPGTATPEAIKYAVATQLENMTGDGAARRRRWRSV
jgi:acetyl-CoA carboxylase carboxyl transferase subunit beta